MARAQRSMLARIGSFALGRGMSRRNRGWLYVAAGAHGLRLLRRVLVTKPEVARFKLRPGEAIEIREAPRAR
jgi:hypothetical protein